MGDSAPVNQSETPTPRLSERNANVSAKGFLEQSDQNLMTIDDLLGKTNQQNPNKNKKTAGAKVRVKVLYNPLLSRSPWLIYMLTNHTTLLPVITFLSF